MNLREVLEIIEAFKLKTDTLEYSSRNWIFRGVEQLYDKTPCLVFVDGNLTVKGYIKNGEICFNNYFH